MMTTRPSLIDCSTERPLRRLYFDLGLALCERGRQAEAVAALAKASEEAGDDPAAWEIHYVQGLAYHSQGEGQAALLAFLESVADAPEKAGELMPYAHDVLTKRAAITQAKWLCDDWARRIPYSALEGEDRAEVAFFLGRVNLYTGDYAQAVDYFRKAERLRPQDTRILEGLGASLLKQGKLDAAQAALDHARKLARLGAYRDRLPAIGARLVRVLIEKGEYRAALERAVESRVEGSRYSDELLLAQGLSYLALGEPEQTLEIVRQPPKDSAEVDVRLLRAQALIAKHQYKDAISTVNQALQYDPGNPGLAFHKIQALIEGDIDLGQAQRLLKHYKKRENSAEFADFKARLESPLLTVRADEGNACYFAARVHYELYERYRKKWTLKQDLEDLERAFSLGFVGKDNNPEAAAWLLKGEILRRKGQRHAAAQAYYEAGRHYGRRNEYQRATELLECANDLDPEHVPTYWYLSDGLRMLAHQADDKEEKKERLLKSLSIWQSGDKLQRSDPSALHSTTHSWALIARALLNEGLGSVQAAKPVDLPPYWWQALIFLERALLLNPYDAHGWTYLGRYYSRLKLESNALAAIDTALKCDENNLAAREEQLINLVNTGRFPEALALLKEDWPSGDDNIYAEWLPLIEAYILSRSGYYPQALEMSAGEQDRWSERKWYWVYHMRAQCYTMLGQPDQALKEHLSIFKDYQDDEIADMLIFGVAAFHIAMLDKKRTDLLEIAIDIARDASTNPAQALEASTTLGYCYLAREETLDEAEPLLLDGINVATNVKELDDLIKLHFKVVETYAKGWDHGHKAKKILKRLEPVISKKRDRLAQRTVSPKEELDQEIASLKDKSGWAWWAAHAGLARIYVQEKRWHDAAGAYQRLLEETDAVPEARIGLENAVDGLKNEGDRHLKEGLAAEAIQLYEQALTFEDDKQRQADLRSRMGYAHFRRADLGNARADFAKAIHLFHEAQVPDPGGALSNACRRLLQDVPQYWALDSEWQAFAEEAGALREDLVAARGSLAVFLIDHFQLMSDSGETRNIPLLVTPVALEIAINLAPAEDGEGWILLTTYLPQLRERMQKEMGVRIPGIRVRTNEAGLSAGGYNIVLDEVPVASGTIELGRYYCTAPEGALTELGIPYYGLSSATDPATGAPVCWVDPEYANSIVDQGLELWTDPQLSMVQHLEAVLRANLASLLGVQEVANLIEMWEGEQGGAELINEVLPDDTARLRLGRVLRALLEEQLTIAPWREILEELRDTTLNGADLHETVRAIRLRLKAHLPGNEPSAERVFAPESFESGISSFLRRRNGTLIMDLPPEETSRLLTEIRGFLQRHEDSVVLIARDPAVRPFMRQLVALEFPRIVVISNEEMLSLDESAIAQSK